ncbi:hypothetical protein [Stenotrophomonas indicatrix]|uniref:hypothetical protein n=1 Tax=Stenotrophomonas indicatrix TaxID=2045451 RepID=UPI0010C33D10|nr:hypothetical protein [Stenotrophomonas indicatrix]QBR46527.1 hypothetical protein DAIF1_41220 [Stenotrophomonas indicatrix]
MNDEAAVTGSSAAEALADRIVRHGQQHDPADFAAWLQQSPELQAPADASAVKLATWQRLMNGTTPFPQANFEQLADRFQWYDRGNIRECYDMAALGHSMHVRWFMHVRWLLLRGNEVALARYMHRDDAPVSVAQARVRVARLSGRWRPLRARWQARSAHTRREMRDTLHYLVGEPIMWFVVPPPPLQRKQVLFWAAAAGNRLHSAPRRRLPLWQRVVVALLLACTLLGALAIAHRASIASPSDTRGDRLVLQAPAST